MHKLKVFAVALVLLAGFSNTAFAQASLASAAHTVTVEVAAISEIAITGDVTLTIDSATAGANPDNATGSTTYDVTTNESNVRITAATNADMPSGVTLSVNASAPSTALSAGLTSLSSTAANVVTSLDPVSQAGMTLGYTLSATAAAGIVAATGYTVTYTILN